MKDKANSRLEEDTEEMRTWRGLNKEEMDQSWKKLAEKWRRKFWTRTAKRRLTEAEAPFLEWRRVRRSGKYRVRKWEEDCWARIFALFKEYNLQRRQSMHEDCTEESENEEATMNEGHERYDEENQIKSKNGC